MRKVILIVASLVVVLLAVWWVKSNELSALPTKVMAAQPPQTRNDPSPPSAVGQTTAISLTTPIASLEERQSAFNAAFKTPIVFYGRVRDQHEEPVSEATVTYYVSDHPVRNSSQYQCKTDGKGFFSISRVTGISLAVQVSKEGYLKIPARNWEVTSSGKFDYAAGTDNHRPDRDKPVIFRLHKVGAIDPLVKVGEKNFRMARDGTPLSIAVDGQGTHQVVLRCWNKEGYRLAGQRQYDWKLEVSVPNGSLFLREDAFAFEAPQDGYAPSDSIDMPSSLPYVRWDSSAERSYFIRFSDGTFARANLEMHAAGDHFVVWESFFNPKVGSRNLESSAESQSASR